FFREIDSSLGFLSLNMNRVHSPDDFFGAMNHVTGSFNWAYIDSRDVAHFHSGRYPIRAAGVDPELPTWGTGSAEWTGFLTEEAHPHSVNPPSGFLSSWNNKPARGWAAADNNYSYRSVHRVQLLNDRLAQLVAPISKADMVRAMEDAATVDLR